MVLYIINRCKVYELLYPRDPKLGKAGQNLEAAPIDLYTLILQFLSAAIRICEQNTATRAIKAFWSPDCIADFDRSFQRLTERAEIEAQNCGRSYSMIERTEQRKALEKLLDEITKIRNRRANS